MANPPLKKDRFKIFWAYPRWYAMAHNKRGESKSMLSLPPPVGCGWVMAFSGGGGGILTGTYGVYKAKTSSMFNKNFFATYSMDLKSV